MKKILITLFVLAATGVSAQTDSTAKDSTYSNYHSYSRDFTEEEMSELIAKDEAKRNNRKEKTRKVKEALGSDVKTLPDNIKYSPQVQEHMNQNKQDYTNYYYRKTKRTLLNIIFGG